ncbi:sulfur carrier protein ThiS [Tissierella sp. Yu-01]|uniref:sulfur carrier protein ThiS n=1 Tax=Tissierella sp. Yu-01 TaxID=3035694 RepID=UPI00240CFE1F|nr:sulfur carrier protein ThiS [Tissierella sp. Yu-01]WFA09996.1 sulfur carrier protein ThiS [Tissierella sp. Yu-01]
MEITVNNKAITIPHDFKILNLLEHLSYNKSVAVFVNGKQLLMSQYDDYLLKDKDTVKIIKPLGGG